MTGREPLRLDNKGRCSNCLAKPIPYRRNRQFFCHRCCRHYSMDTGEQQPNWAWALRDGRYYPIHETDEYALAVPTANALRRAHGETVRMTEKDGK